MELNAKHFMLISTMFLTVMLFRYFFYYLFVMKGKFFWASDLSMRLFMMVSPLIFHRFNWSKVGLKKLRPFEAFVTIAAAFLISIFYSVLAIHCISNILKQLESYVFLKPPNTQKILLHVYSLNPIAQTIWFSFFVAPSEEIFFRGFIQNIFHEKLGWLSGVIFSSFFFSLYLFPLYAVFPLALLIGLSFAVPAALINAFTRKIWVPLIWHALNDLRYPYYIVYFFFKPLASFFP